MAFGPPGTEPSTQQQVVLGVDAQHLQVAHRHPVGAHVAAHAHALDHARRVRRGADRAGRPVEHRAVRSCGRRVKWCRLTTPWKPLPRLVPMTSTRSPSAKIETLTWSPGFGGVAAGLDLHLAAHARRRHAGLLEVARASACFPSSAWPRRGRAAPPRSRRSADVFTCATTHGPGLEHRRRRDGAVRREQLRHADFLADESCHHHDSWLSLWLSRLRSDRPTSRAPCRTP